MNRDQFLKELRDGLAALPQDELNSAIEYYEEYFNESQLSEEETINNLGSPKKIADEFLREYNISKTNDEESLKGELILKNKPRSGLPVWLIIVLTLLAIPIILPTACGIFVGFLGIVGALIAVIAALWVAAAGVFVSGVGAVIGAIISPIGFFDTLMQSGVGFMLVGAGILAVWGMTVLIINIFKITIRGIAALGRNLLRGGEKK